AVLELLKTRRILKCSYPYGFFLEPKSTKKEIYELMQTDLEMVTEDLAQKVNRPYLRTPRHKIIRAACLVQQKRQEFLASVARGVAPNDSPEAPRRSFAGGTWDWEYLGFASPEEYADFQYRRRHRQRRRGDMSSLRSDTPDPDDPDSASDYFKLQTPNQTSTTPCSCVRSGSKRKRRESCCCCYSPHRCEAADAAPDALQGLGSLEDDDPNILLAIQLSLQDSGMAGSESSHDILCSEASLGAIGTSLPSRLEQSSHSVEVLPRASLSSSELLELGDNLSKQGKSSSNSSTGIFSSSSDKLDSTTSSSRKASSPSALAANANLLGNIMAWFHDMNPHGIALVPPTSSDTDSD
uniref:Uncharacterized protein n=1 Tax=Tetraodon nigroviridis TaxID=99883 RepID=H3DP60_TETNG